MSRSAARSATRERTISIRLVWPFVRVLGVDAAGVAEFEQAGVGAKEFGNPDTRVPHRTLQNMLRQAIERRGDPTVGLRAAESLDPADLDVLEYAGRSCDTLRDAAHCVTRYMRLLNDAADVRLEERGDVAIWESRVTDGVTQEPAANDFELAAYTNLAKRTTGHYDQPPLEIHFAHAVATSESEYARLFGCPIKLGMPYNAIIFPRHYLDSPMVHANPTLHAAFEAHVDDLLARLPQNDSIAARTRAMLAANLSKGQTGMAWVAQELALSVPTLRRRLAEENTSHSELLDEVRRDLAMHYLQDPHLAITEVAFLLGFSHTAGFYKAFRRWEGGASPMDFRKRAR